MTELTGPARTGTVAVRDMQAGVTPYALGVTSGGEPVHPLRQRADAPLVPWSPRA